jgi:hypothetical protein
MRLCVVEDERDIVRWLRLSTPIMHMVKFEPRRFGPTSQDHGHFGVLATPFLRRIIVEPFDCRRSQLRVFTRAKDSVMASDDLDHVLASNQKALCARLSWPLRSSRLPQCQQADPLIGYSWDEWPRARALGGQPGASRCAGSHVRVTAPLGRRSLALRRTSSDVSRCHRRSHRRHRRKPSPT